MFKIVILTLLSIIFLLFSFIYDFIFYLKIAYFYKFNSHIYLTYNFHPLDINIFSFLDSYLYSCYSCLNINSHKLFNCLSLLIKNKSNNTLLLLFADKLELSELKSMSNLKISFGEIFLITLVGSCGAMFLSSINLLYYKYLKYISILPV